MKKFFMLLLVAMYTLLSPLSIASASAESEPTYACILTDDVYFYTSESEHSGIFTLPRTYYVKVLSIGEPFTQVEYLTDGEHTQTLRGYCLTEELTFVDYTPVNPYLYATFEVIYTVQDGDENDDLLGKISVTCGYYGNYSIGSKEYAYVLQRGEYVYVPKPADFTYAENGEYASRQEPTPPSASTDGSDPIRIAVLAVLCLLVPLLAAIILQSSKRHSYEADE